MGESWVYYINDCVLFMFEWVCWYVVFLRLDCLMFRYTVVFVIITLLFIRLVDCGAYVCVVLDIWVYCVVWTFGALVCGFGFRFRSFGLGGWVVSSLLAFDLYLGLTCLLRCYLLLTYAGCEGGFW